MAVTNEILVFAGLLMYWLTSMGSAAKQNPNTFHALNYIEENVFELLTGVLSCLIMCLLSHTIDKSLIDVDRPLAALLAGYGNNSIFTKLLSYRK